MNAIDKLKDCAVFYNGDDCEGSLIRDEVIEMIARQNRMLDLMNLALKEWLEISKEWKDLA